MYAFRGSSSSFAGAIKPYEIVEEPANDNKAERRNEKCFHEIEHGGQKRRASRRGCRS
jgi:hypothetical protein